MIKLKDIINEMALFPSKGTNGEYTTTISDKEPAIGSGDSDEVLPTASFKVNEFVRKGIKIYSAYTFNQAASAPEGFKTAIRKGVKDSNNPENKELLSKLISRKLKYMKNKGMLDKIDALVPLGSTSKLNLLIAEEIKKMIPSAIVYDNVITKVKWKNVKVVDKGEASKKGYDYAKKVLERMQLTHPEDYFEIKKTGASQSVRRYFSMFYEIKPGYDVNLIEQLHKSNVLLIDDTMEEGVTIQEAYRVINTFDPISIKAFVFLAGN